MRKVYQFIPAMIFMACILSCETQEELSPDDNRIVEDRLHFNSKEDLNSFILEAKKKDYREFQLTVREYEKSGFKSLMPVFDKENQTELENYKTFKTQQRKNFYNHLYDEAVSEARVAEEEIDLTEDEFIADPYFASLLNRDREIEVGHQIYKYTAKGILYASKRDYKLLAAAADELQHSHGRLSMPATKGVSFYSPSRAEAAKTACVDPLSRCAPEAPTPTPGPTPTPTPPAPVPTKEEVKSSLKVCFWDPNIWDDIFGPAESCEDYFESDKRIKTKTWSQNYLLFSSVGIKVESQNRFLRIWWADDINEVELGYTSVYFEYKLPTPSWPSNKFEYQYVHGDYRINQYGQYLGNAAGGPKSIFSEFPIKDADKRILTIYLFQPLEDILGKSSIDLTAKDVNKGIESLVKQGFSTMKSYLNKEINGTTAVVVYPSADGGTLKFLFTNWVRTNSNDNKISETFDWNTAIIGFSTKGSSTSPIYDSPQSYKKFQTICYGMGRRGTTWKGSRVVLLDTK